MMDLSNFRVWEGREELPADLVRSLVDGEYVALVVRDYMGKPDCERIRTTFLNHPGLRVRRDIPAIELGVNSYGLEFRDYLLQARQSFGDLWDLMVGTSHPIVRVFGDFQRSLPGGSILRPAIDNGLVAPPFRAVSWTDVCKVENGDLGLALGLHEDVSQLNDVGIQASEVAKVVDPLAINLYPSAAEEGGELVVYNVRPDMLVRAKLGLETTGYPYPEDFVRDVESLRIVITEGCLVLLRGSFVHGVCPSFGGSPRILLNSFVGAIDATTYVYYT